MSSSERVAVACRAGGRGGFWKDEVGYDWYAGV